MAHKQILVVDDEEDILELIRYNLEKEGYKVAGVGTGEACLDKARSIMPDLIVLDLMLPGIDGLNVCKILKNDSKTANIPVVMLTAKGEEADIVAGLELGADDYIAKPFSQKVLTARVRAVLRRAREMSMQSHGEEIRRKELIINSGRREVLLEGQSLTLTFSEFEILALLARRPGWVFTRSQIVNNVKGDDYPVTDRSIDVQIVGLRKKLGQHGEYIETIRGVGYRFQDN